MLSSSRHVPLSCHDEVALFEWRRLWRWINKNIENYIIIASLRSETMGKLINWIPGFASFDIKFTRFGLENACWIARQASWCQQAFSKPCQVNLITKDVNLVFSISKYLYMLILDGISAVCRKNISEVAGTGRNGTCALSAEVLHSTKKKSNNFKGMLRRGRISKILAKKTENTIFS